MSTEGLLREIELVLSRDDALDLSILLDEGAVLPDLRGYYEVLYDESKPREDTTTLILFFPMEDVAAAARLEVLLTARGISEFETREKILDKRDYLEAYKEHYKPFALSERLAIIPSWHRGSETEREVLGDGRIALYLDPGLAFGTGHHPTSRMCLRRLEFLVKPGLRMIDAGCGSGILSLGAALLGADYIYAFDVDGNAVQGTHNNMELNASVQGKIQVFRGGFDAPGFRAPEKPYDLLTANLQENIILAEAELIDAGPYGRMLLSGILTEQADSLISRFSDWKLAHRDDDDGWAMLEFERGAD